MSDTKPAPMSAVVNELRDIVDEYSSTDFSIYYDEYTLAGDIQYVRTKVRAAWEKKNQENYKANDHRVDAKETLERTELVAGELEYALDRIDDAIKKVEAADGDQYGLLPILERNREIIKQHKQAAENDELYYSDA